MFFFFNDPATTEIYTLSLHDALPILPGPVHRPTGVVGSTAILPGWVGVAAAEEMHRRLELPILVDNRSEEHTSELQSQFHLVCRLLLEKKKKKIIIFRANQPSHHAPS